jgi:cell division protein FtsW (lipid II flippase)
MMLKASDAIIVCICALLGVGVLMVNSALMSVAPDRAVSIQSVLLSRPAMFAVLAALALVVASRVPLAWLASPKVRWAMGFPLLVAILTLLAMV